MLHLVPALRKVFRIQRHTWCEDTRSCDSPRRLFRISRICYVKMYPGRLSGHYFPCRQQSRHRSVAVSPEEYMSELSVGTSSQSASSMQMPCSTVVSFTEAIWLYFTLFYVKVNIGSCVGSPSWCFVALCPVASVTKR